ncbi:MAG: ferredoxin family protein [Candidatus Riflebacteria bacterium]|nr:ferredoxin family protein [Candidatus Riflebacteria bacterium]
MAHVVTPACNKDYACVEQCPVECFYEGDNQLYIHPDECIDCSACVSVCPANAIYAIDDVPAEHKASVEENATRAKSGIAKAQPKK